MAESSPLVKRTLDVLVLEALSWTPVHGTVTRILTAAAQPA